MATQLFRKEVIEAGRDRLAGSVIAATPPRSRLYLGLVLTAAAIMLLFLILGSYASTVQMRGLLAYDAGMARVYPAASAEVRAIHVQTGQSVAAGDPLVTIALAQGRGGVDGQVSQLDLQDAELARQAQLSSMLGATEARGLRVQQSNLEAGIASLERQQSIASGQIRIAEAALRRATQLAEEGAGTQRQVEDSRANLLSRQAEVESLSERIIAQRDILRQLDARVSQRVLEAERGRSEIAARRAALSEQRQGLVRTDKLVLAAPIAGVVRDIAAYLGQRARPEASLVTIAPAESRLEAWLYAPSRGAGFARPGQEVRLHFDAFPLQRFGAGRGTVVEVSSVPTEPEAIEADLGLSEPVFRMRVRIDRLPRRAPEQQLRPGMTLSAKLVLERRSLLEILFNPVVMASEL